MKKILIAIITTASITMTLPAAEGTASSSGSQLTAPSTGVDPLDRPFEAGIIFGEPTGLSLKYWTSEILAVDAGIGWSFDNDTDLHLHGDVLWHNFEWLDVPKGELPIYFGVGARAQFRSHRDDRVGIRIPFGMSYMFEDVPLSAFIEIAPVLDLAPSTHGDFTAGIGLRYRF